MYKIGIICSIIVFASVMTTLCEAKRGCSSYGHSCYGGHGKRSDTPIAEGFSLDGQMPLGKLFQTNPREIQLAAANNIDSMDSKYANEDTNDKEMRYAMMNLYKQWIEDYRKARKSDAVFQEDIFKESNRNV